MYDNVGLLAQLQLSRCRKHNIYQHEPEICTENQYITVSLKWCGTVSLQPGIMTGLINEMVFKF